MAYRTKRVILEIYDEMAESMRTGKPYQTRLDPPRPTPAAATLQRKSKHYDNGTAFRYRRAAQRTT